MSVQYKGQIFYRVCQEVKINSELLTYYGDQYSHSLGVDPKVFKEKLSFKTFWNDPGRGVAVEGAKAVATQDHLGSLACQGKYSNF